MHTGFIAVVVAARRALLYYSARGRDAARALASERERKIDRGRRERE